MTTRIKKRVADYKRKINKLTFGLFDTITDVCLFIIFFHLQSYQIAYGKRSLMEAFRKAIDLTKIANPNNLQRIIYKLKRVGYLEKKERYLRITELGEKRLSRSLPKYEKERPWDGVLYLITYDIPEERKRERDFLRDYLERLGCAMLQYSVWLTPYNPKKLIADFVKERNLKGLVLVSELKEGSSIGGMDILKVLEKIYKLERLNEEYRNFVEMAESKKLSGVNLIMSYLSILKRDPQLPFELLPGNWWGEEAYEWYKKTIKKFQKPGKIILEEERRIKNYTN